MPGGSAAPPPSGDVGDPAVDYANVLAKAVGLDPRVAYAWQKAEGHPGDLPGYYNYMNITTATASSLGIPTVGTGPAGTAKFGNVGIGESAAIAEITSPAIGIKNEKGKSIAQQISDIAASPWASSHYGGAGGPNLLADFRSMYPGVDVGSSSQTPLPAAGGGKDQAQTGLPNPVDWLTAPITSVADAFKFLFSYRFLEILGGGLLILLGLYILAQQFQKVALAQGIPLPGPAKQAAAAADPFSQGLASEAKSQSRNTGRREARRNAKGETATSQANEAGRRADAATAYRPIRVVGSSPRPTMKRKATAPAPSPTPARRRGVSSQPNKKQHGRQVRVKG